MRGATAWFASGLFGAGFGGALWVAGHGEARAERRSTAAASALAPFALVELFTSEGCSSCLPADELLHELAAEARPLGRRIFPVAFHVDYWDGLGWRDPWGRAAFSQRQSRYAGAFEARYTPQMVVNGAEAFVGSDRVRARRALDAALSKPAGAALRLQLETERDTLRVGYEVSPAPRRGELHVALVERGLVSRVARGENRGRTLRHGNTVRGFESVELGPGGEAGRVRIAVPRDLVAENAAVIAWVQDGKSQRILGATSLDLTGAPAP